MGTFTTLSSRRARTAVAVVAGALLLGVSGLPASAAPETLATAPNRQSHKIVHSTVEGARRRAPRQAGTATGSGQLTYHGGVDGIGVTTGQPKVYFVFWGAGWGTPNSSGSETTLSGDASGVAPVLQRFFKGLGTNSELWSGVMSQYCEGVGSGTSTCPAASSHVGYPTGGALAGVWADPSTTAITSSGSTPTSPVDHDIAAEAILAAAHFGNTTASSNRNAQYVILSPSGTHPGGFNSPLQWCAWHDYNGDTTLVGGAAVSAYGDIAFTNMPYITDVGASCGANYVNSSGALDGVTIVEGHEYAETITDQNPSGGWWDAAGYENGDKCAWVGVGGAGGAQNIALATGSFAVQATYSNDGSACLVSHAIVSASTSDFSLSASPASVTVANGASSPSITVSTAQTFGAAGTIALSVSGVPSGASASVAPGSVTAGSSATLTISAASAASGTYPLTVTGTESGVTHTTTVSLVVPGLVNGGFESSFTGWSRSGTTSSVTSPVHSGNRAVVAGSLTNRTNGDSSVTQTFIGSGSTLSFWYLVRCPENVSVDWATATLGDNTAASSTTLLARTCTNSGLWVQVTTTVTPGHSYTLKLTNHDNNSRTFGRNTYTVFDDVLN